MDPLTVSTVISAPREAVFDYLQDIANHAEFTDHFLVDWHLTRVDPVGRGAGARFRVKAPGNRFSWADVTFAEVERPHRIVEVGRTGKNNRIRTLGVVRARPAAPPHDARAFTLETEPGDALGPPDGEPRRARLAASQERPRDAPAARDPRARTSDRGQPRDGRRWIDCRAHVNAACATSRSSRPPLLAALALGACGDSHTKVTTGTYAGESGQNAPYLDVGPLVYEVQLSRQLNPYDSEDSRLSEGLTPSSRQAADRARSGSACSCRSTTTPNAPPGGDAITISDTAGQRLHADRRHRRPTTFVYRGGTVPAQGRLPKPNTTPPSGPTQGALLLFKIKVASLDNRPLEIQDRRPRQTPRKRPRPSSTSSAQRPQRAGLVQHLARAPRRAPGACRRPRRL